jgi:hypothetical protein
MAKVTWNRAGWNQIVQDVINKTGVPAMERVAAACNQDAGLGDGGYMVSVEGSDPLQKRDYRATVITVTDAAKADNAKNNRLIDNFYQAGA